MLRVVEAGESPTASRGLAAIRIEDPTPDGVPEVARRVALGAVNVLIGGETGSGKEVLARTLHQLSGRRGRFVAINCATLGEALAESELFGHERGAFTGAAGAKPGLLEVARDGTVLLDEVGELPLATQAKLLRALETREVYRVGGVTPVRLELRLLSATHRDLARDVADGRFRRDLYFRLNGITLDVVPLRERPHAIRALAETILAEDQPAPRLSRDAVDALLRHPWPGNVRELRAVLGRARFLADGGAIDEAHIAFDRIPAEARGLDDQAYLEETAAAHEGNVTAIARHLGTSRSQVRRLALRFGVDLSSYRRWSVRTRPQLPRTVPRPP